METTIHLFRISRRFDLCIAGQSASDMYEYISFVLSQYGKTMNNVVAIIADNCEANKCLSDQCEVPLIGCHSHRLALAVKEFLKQDEAVLSKVHALMVKLESPNLSGELKKYTSLRPIVNNTTRWLSVMQMIERYMKIKDHLQHIPAMISFMLCPAEDARLKELGELLEPLKSVTLALQRSDMDMASARLLLDEIIKKVSIDGRKKYIHVNSSIVKNKDFENGVVKILNSDENLTLQENLAVKKLRLHVQEVEEMGKENEVPLDFAMEILRKRRCERRSDKYLDCRFLVPTSNLMERLFSRAGYAYDDLRRKIQPIYLEQQLFLMSNKRLWDLSLVNEVVNATE